NVKTFWGSTNDWTRAFSTGQAVIGNAWSSLPAELSQADITLALQKEGSVGWVVSWTMVKNAPHPALAYAWINYMTGVQFLTSFAKDPTHSSPAPANMAAVKQLSTSLLTRLGAKPAWLSRLAFVQVTPADLKNWTQLWETVKAGG